MKDFVGKVQTRPVPFMDGEVEVKTLTVGNARDIEAKTREINEAGDQADQLELLRYVIRLSVVGAEDLTDDELDGFPVSELTKLSEAIMGMSNEGND